ncbi:cilia- and flagella-associated protein 251-like [Penaeus monodon]|uniref:cilia- and flagella-associated protein 251-like n=1 Tax=Penaeus monodon TaxID=6687 RepID=UPI0018A72117|nr:cilia- and flagella-associated protein 251-like [Penaeus monodon]
MDQREKLKGKQRNAKNTKYKPQESQSDDSDDQYDQSEDSDVYSSSHESNGEEEKSGEDDEEEEHTSEEDEEEDQLSEESEDDGEEGWSTKGNEDDEDESSSEETGDEEEEQSREGTEDDEDEKQSSEESEDDEEEKQLREGCDSEEDEYTTDENDPNGEQDSDSDKEDEAGSESSEGSSRQPERQSPREQHSKYNPEKSTWKKDLDNQTQLHKRLPSKPKKSQGKTPSPAKPAEKLGINQEIPRQKGTPPQSTRPAKKPPTSGTITKNRDARWEKGKSKQAGKPKPEQERKTKRPKAEELEKAESPHMYAKMGSEREKRKPNTSTEMKHRARMSRKDPKTSRKDSRDLRTFNKENCDYEDDDYVIPSKSDVRKCDTLQPANQRRVHKVFLYHFSSISNTWVKFEVSHDGRWNNMVLKFNAFGVWIMMSLLVINADRLQNALSGIGRVSENY